jgi:deoxyribose-phosphate aldolase
MNVVLRRKGSASRPNRCGVKASGGIRNLASVKELLEAGATRIGASASVADVRELGAE